MHAIHIRRGLAALVVTQIAALGLAQDPIHEDFESYAAGPLDGQGHWRVNDDDASNVAPMTGPNGSLTQTVELSPNADSACAFLDATTTQIENGKWLVTMSVLVESGFTGESQVSLANHFDELPIDWYLHIRLNGASGLLHCDCGGGTISVPLVVDQWTTIRIVVTLPTGTFGDVQLMVYYAEQLVVGFFTPPIMDPRIDGIRLTTGPSSDPNDVIYFDNLEVIPFDLSAPGMPRCFGAGAVTPCPCGNEVGSTDAAGCRNSSGVGAALTAGGSNSIAAGNLVLTCTGALPSQPGVFLQGEETLAGGFGLSFGDGLRCCGAGVIRLATLLPDANGLATTTVDGASTGATPGDFKCYQFWYRDPVSVCGGRFNLSNGYEVYWRP